MSIVADILSPTLLLDPEPFTPMAFFQPRPMVSIAFVIESLYKAGDYMTKKMILSSRFVSELLELSK